MTHDGEIFEPLNNLESLRMRIENALWAEKAFIKYCSIALAVLVVVAVAKGGVSSTNTISIFGKLEIPTSLIAKQVWIVKYFFSSLLLYAFIEWVLAIIDVNRHPMSEAYCGQKSAVALLADRWDKLIKIHFLQVTGVLDILQKVLFLTMFGLILISLWTL
jgi:hypothetical protein